VAIQVQHRVLVVEDDPATRHITTTVLALNNYEVFSANNGVEALPILKQKRPRVMVCDLQMPRMDGYVLLRLVARFFPEVGVIVVGGAFQPLRGTLGALLADAFFAKGEYSAEDLVDCVAALAARFPLRPSSKPSGLSLAWVPQEDAHSLWVACRNCLRCFSLVRPPAQFRVGIQRVYCPSCSAQVKFLLEESAMQRLAVAA
jgi:CheY-like chemotaxis protein